MMADTGIYKNNKDKLHLGCGNVIKEGWLNHDLVPLPGVDIVHNLTKFPWPFDDHQFNEVYMKDVLEHLPNTIRTMEELYRITKPGAKVYITVPYWNSAPALGDPTHVRLFNEFSFNYLDPTSWLCKERPYYTHARFYIRRIGVWITPFEPILRLPVITRDYVIFNRLLKSVLLSLSNIFCNVVNCIDVHLERAK